MYLAVHQYINGFEKNQLVFFFVAESAVITCKFEIKNWTVELYYIRSF